MKTTLPFLSARRFMLLLAGSLLAVSSVRAQDTTPLSDTNFVKEAALGGMTEVKVGKMAVQHGTTEGVKEFGKMLVKDHSVINRELKALAAKKGYAVPDRLDDKHQALVDKLSGLPGSEFDDTFVIEMVKAHQRDIKAFKDELANTSDPDFQSFINKTIPTLEAHLKQVSGLQKAGVNTTLDEKVKKEPQ